MTKNSPILKLMKATLVAIAMLVSAASIRAQGLILQNVDFGDDSVVNLESSTSILLGGTDFVGGEINFINGVSYGELPQSPSFGIQQLGLDTLPPTSPDTSLDFQSQASSLTIQAVPEPSTLALGSLALGLIALVRFKKQQRA